ncbi:unnamed protein product, partial [marine sediment metagenome]
MYALLEAAGTPSNIIKMPSGYLIGELGIGI